MEHGDLVKYERGELSHAESVALFFSLYPEKERALRSFLEHEDQFSREKIRSGLRAKMQPEEPPAPTVHLPANIAADFIDYKPARDALRGLDITTLPDDLRVRYNQLGPIYKKLQYHHPRLGVVATNQQRKDICKDIYQLTLERRAILTALDDFIAGKRRQEAPPVAAPVSLDGPKDFEKEDQIRKLMSRRSKAKNKPELYQELDRQIKELRSSH
jgi:hypothetical protein